MSLQQKKDDDVESEDNEDEIEDQSNDITDNIFILIAALTTTEYYNKLLIPLWKEAAKTGNQFFNDFQFTKPDDGTSFNDIEQEVDTWLQSYSKQQTGYINNTTRNQVQRIIKNGLTCGDNFDKIANDLVEYISSIASSRSRRIANTEIHNVFGKTNFLSAEYKGFKNKTWITMEDAKVRPVHNELDGMTIPVSEEFLPGLSYPGDSNASPSLVINCRCILSYS